MFVLVPMGFAVYYSLFRWRGVGPPTEFVGLRNYTLAFQDPIFLDALRNNAIIVFGSLLIQGPIALGVALLLNRRFRGRAVFRLLVFVPYVLAEVTVGIMWKLLLTGDGTVDALLRSLGMGGLVQAWLADLDVVIWTLLAVLTWKYVGFAIILLPRRPVQCARRADRGGRASTARAGGRSNGTSRSRCSARRSGSGCSCR